jgi:hypothetical protein
MEWTPKKVNKDPIPTFLEMWEAGENGEMSKRVMDFVARAYSKIIARELMTTLEEMAEKGEINEEQLMEEAKAIWQSDDDTKKAEYIQRLVTKYSLTANALLLAGTGIPDDISGLFPDE